MEFPEVDVFRILGVAAAPETYVLIAGLTELLFGFLRISGAAPQAAVLAAGCRST